MLTSDILIISSLFIFMRVEIFIKPGAEDIEASAKKK